MIVPNLRLSLLFFQLPASQPYGLRSSLDIEVVLKPPDKGNPTSSALSTQRFALFVRTIVAKAAHGLR